MGTIMKTKTIEDIADKLLATNPDTPVRVRLLRDVLPGSSPRELQKALTELMEHPTYAMLREIRVIKPPKHGTAISRLKGSLRERGDVFRAAIKIGLTEADPHMAVLIKGMSSYVEALYGTRPWNDDQRSNHDRFSLLSTVLRLPGTLALISPDSPVVVDARRKATAQVEAHYEADDYSTEFEDKALRDIYGSDTFKAEALAIHRSMAHCTTTYPAIYDAAVFRLVGTGARDLDDDVCLKYCDHMLRRHELIKGWVPVQEQIIAGGMPGERPGTPAAFRPEVFAREIARHLIQIQDQMLFPCWRELVTPFVDWLWEQQRDDGLWDLGPIHNGSGDADRLRLSRNWRSYQRYQDWTINILLIMNEYYQESIPNKMPGPYC
jgi:hypothetical protein